MDDKGEMDDDSFFDTFQTEQAASAVPLPVAMAAEMHNALQAYVVDNKQRVVAAAKELREIFEGYKRLVEEEKMVVEAELVNSAPVPGPEQRIARDTISKWSGVLSLQGADGFAKFVETFQETEWEGPAGFTPHKGGESD